MMGLQIRKLLSIFKSALFTTTAMRVAVPLTVVIVVVRLVIVFWNRSKLSQLHDELVQRGQTDLESHLHGIVLHVDFFNLSTGVLAIFLVWWIVSRQVGQPLAFAKKVLQRRREGDNAARLMIPPAKDLAELFETMNQALDLADLQVIQLHEMLNAIPIPLAVIGSEDGRIRYVNRLFLVKFGGTVESNQGKTLANFLGEQGDCVDVKSLLEEYGSLDRHELKLKIQDGSVHWFSIWARPFMYEGEPAFMKVLIDISRRKATEEELRTGQEKYQLLTDNSQDIITRMDPYGNLLYVSPAATSLLGYDPVDLVGTSVFSILHSEDIEPAQRTLTRVLQSEHGLAVTFRIRHKDGHYIYVETMSGALRDTSGNVYELINSTRNVNDRILAELELNKARDELETQYHLIESLNKELQASVQDSEAASDAAYASAAAKSEFLANMSHEIRTPMNGILGMADMLRDSTLTREQKDHVDTIRRCGEGLLVLINDILDLSKIEASRMAIEHIEFDLVELIEDVGDLLSLQAFEKNLDFAVVIPPQLPSRYRGDPNRIRQIIYNLAGNAIKFTHGGDVIIRALVEARNDLHTTVRVQVEDTGIGIPRERLSKLFQPFFQADSSTTRHYGGTGLGLVICKKLVELMGGVINVETTEGVGSTFWFTVPLELVDKEGWLSKEKMEAQHIVIAETHEATRTSLRLRLEALGHDVTIFDEMTQAIRYVKRHSSQNSVDTVFFSAASGCEILGAEQRKGTESASIMNTRWIAMTRMGNKSDREYLDHCAAGFEVKKPPRTAALIAALTPPGAKLSKNRSSVESHGHFSSEGTSEVREVDEILAVEDNLVNQKVIGHLLGKLHLRHTLVDSGIEAVRLAKDRQFAAILMDIQMPDMDGFEAARLIRSDATSLNQSTPVIALTAHALSGDRERCLEAGMSDYLAKPISMSALRECLAKWVAVDREPVKHQ